MICGDAEGLTMLLVSATAEKAGKVSSRYLNTNLGLTRARGIRFNFESRGPEKVAPTSETPSYTYSHNPGFSLEMG